MTEFEKEFDVNFDNEISKTIPRNYDFYWYKQLMSARTYFKDWQPPKEKVKIPKEMSEFVDSYIDINDTSIQYVLKDFVKTEVYHYVRENFEKYGAYDVLLFRAIHEGYEVDKEKLYYVRFVDDGKSYLNKSSFQIFISTCDETNVAKTKFTEKEIKDIDERFWQFAVEVEDDKRI